MMNGVTEAGFPNASSSGANGLFRRMRTVRSSAASHASTNFASV